MNLFKKNNNNIYRFAPRMRRPLSGRKHFANIIVEAENNQDIQKTKEGVDIHSTTTFNVLKDGVVVSNFYKEYKIYF